MTSDLLEAVLILNNAVEETKGDAADEIMMEMLLRDFSRNHAVSIHLNLLTIGATLWYGWCLALQFGY